MPTTTDDAADTADADDDADNADTTATTTSAYASAARPAHITAAHSGERNVSAYAGARRRIAAHVSASIHGGAWRCTVRGARHTAAHSGLHPLLPFFLGFLPAGLPCPSLSVLSLLCATTTRRR